MPSPSQPELFDGDLLVRRLRALGLRGVDRVELHDNRAVMVSVTPRGVLRVHRGYAYAPDSVLAAIVRFVRPGVPRRRRAECREAIVSFPVHDYVGPRRPRRRRPYRPGTRDRALIDRLERRHAELNALHFGGTLPPIRFRLSDRMRTRLGEVLLDEETERPVEIALSRRHIVRDGWREVDVTLLHEMIHQWQAETGRAVDHGPGFRAKARAVGIPPRATRHIQATTFHRKG